MDLSQHPFTTGGRHLLFSGVLREEVFAWLALIAFVLCVAAFLIKCAYKVAPRRLNVPKTLHMSLAAGLFFITLPLQNLDVAFQKNRKGTEAFGLFPTANRRLQYDPQIHIRLKCNSELMQSPQRLVEVGVRNGVIGW